MMNYPNNGSGHNNSSHHRRKNNIPIPEDEEVSERSDGFHQYGYGYGYDDSDDNTSFAESSSSFTPSTSNWMSHHRSPSDSTYLYDQITIFQAAPLAGVSHGLSKELVPIAELHLEKERLQLERIFRQTNRTQSGYTQVNVEFQIATHETLGKFLETKQGTILHFSCHGDAGCLFLENDWGGLAPLAKENLQKWVQLNGGALQFVFVSACYSESIGQAFVDAGVPHVVCSREDAKLMVGVASEFEKTFYRNLAHEKTVKEAFDIAIQATVANSTIPDKLRQREVEKYCLLPKDADHNVPVFFQQQQRQQQLLQTPAIPGPPSRKQERTFPPPPKVFIGRAVDQYKILQFVRQSRLTCVHGPSGMGKTALVKAVCQYVFYRRNMMDFSDGIQWIDTSQEHLMMLRSEEGEHWQPIIDLIHAGSNNKTGRGEKPISNREFLQEEGAGAHILKLAAIFANRKTLLVVDAKKISKKRALRKLSIFLEEFLRQTHYVKVIVIYKEKEDIDNSKLPKEHQVYGVGPLTFEWSARLFARLFPEELLKERNMGIGTRQELCNVLIPPSNNGEQTNTTEANVKPRQKSLWSMFGDGEPRFTIDIAKTFTKEQYSDLLILCAIKDESDLTLEKFLELDRDIEELENRKEMYEQIGHMQAIEQCRQMLFVLDKRKEVYARANLETRHKELQKEIEIALNEKKHTKAIGLQNKQKELEIIKERLPTLIELENQREELEFEIKLAGHNNLLEAKRKQKDLNFTLKAIKAERNAFGDTDDIPESRAYLEAKIMKMEAEVKTFVQTKKFAKAGKLKPEIDRLKEMRSMVPSAADFRNRISSLNASLDKAIAEEDYASAETLQCRIDIIEEKLKTEEEAEENYGLRVPSAAVERLSVASAASVSRRSASTDPGDDPVSMQPPALKAVKSADPPGMALRTESRLSGPQMIEGKKGARNRYSASDFSLRPPVRALQTIVPSQHDSVATQRHSNVTQPSQSSQAGRRPDPSDNGIAGIGPGAYAVRGNSSRTTGDDEDAQGSAFSTDEESPAPTPATDDKHDIVFEPIMGTAASALPSALEVVDGIVEHQELLEQQIVQIMKKHAVQAATVVPVPEPSSSDRDISVDFSAYTNSSRDTNSLRESLETEEKKGGMKGLFKKLRNRKASSDR